MRAPSYFRAPRVASPTPVWALLIILAAALAVIFWAALRYAIGRL